MKFGTAKIRKVLTIALIVIIALVFAPKLVGTAFGQDTPNPGQAGLVIEAADTTAAPTATFYGKAIGEVTPGDLFYIDATASQVDFTLNLYITNADDLIHYLRYLTLQVAVYVKDGEGNWIKPQLNGEQAETYLTLQNSPATFTLTGGAQYKITVEDGCFNCLSAGNAEENPAPKFFLDAAPL
jgi:hypothetical protein